MVTTSKRTYMIKLKSSNYGYVVRAGFYYPSQEVISYNNQQTANKNSEFDNSQSKSLIELSKLNYQYEIVGKDYDWKPLQVFDDNISVYIKLPSDISSRSLPGLCIVNQLDKSQCELVNFKYNHQFYIINKLFEEAKLMNGFGKHADTIIIRKKHKKTLFGSGFLLSEKVAAEKVAAEKEIKIIWELSPKELEIIKSLDCDNCS
jgi:type IV secretion system protein VirB9